jgi:hypothetical protein
MADPILPKPLALFDQTHGQANWARTGFTARTASGTFEGLKRLLNQNGSACRIIDQKPLSEFLQPRHLLVIPPPTGQYVIRPRAWSMDQASIFSDNEIVSILSFLNQGGRLLSFAYRFGDSFTKTNLGQLYAALGCLLNDDAVIDMPRLKTTHPLHSKFETMPEALHPEFATTSPIRWRAMATFTILPNASAHPVAFSPGGPCIAYNATFRRLTFESRRRVFEPMTSEGL